MPSVVLDTNVLISANLNPQGLESFVLSAALSGALQFVVSHPILREYEAVLLRPKFRFAPQVISELLALIGRVSILVLPDETLTISPDEDDNRFLECAAVARADYLVTGNRSHFPARWKSTQIVNARELIEQIFGV